MEVNSKIKQVLNKALWARLQKALCASYTSDSPQIAICWSYICTLTRRYIKTNERVIYKVLKNSDSAFPSLSFYTMSDIVNTRYFCHLSVDQLTSSRLITSQLSEHPGSNQNPQFPYMDMCIPSFLGSDHHRNVQNGMIYYSIAMPTILNFFPKLFEKKCEFLILAC